MIMAETNEYTTGPLRLTLDEMKQFLWSAAVRLRGQIDAAGYKEYIFPLLFFKRISDVYDEQYDGYVAEGGAEYANSQVEDFAIRIPDKAHWRDVRAVTENVGQRLVEAFIAIEQANPGVRTDGRIVGGLEGIFGPKDIWTNKNKMPDHIITSLIEDFSRHNLSLASCPADEMGQAYEYLIGKFADDAGNTAQEFYTNRTVVTLMAEILKPQPGESVYDPTCGSGGMLVKCLDYLREKGQPWQSVKVFGQEINALTSSIARMNLYLNGVEDFSIVREDTLARPGFVDGSHLRTFDIVLANPPYSIKTWNRDAFTHDRWGRNMWGTPIQARADYAFIQHIVSSMNANTGRSATLLPHGVLNREEDKEIRINHVKSDTIEAIIGLGRNLFYNSGLESCVLICSNNKSQKHKHKILFIEAESCTHKQGKQAYLFEEDIRTIVDAYNADEDIPGLSRLVDIDEVLKNDGNLNIKSYVKKEEDSETQSLCDIIRELSDVQGTLSRAFAELPFECEKLPAIEYTKARRDCPSEDWKLVRLADVAEEYSVRVDNPSESESDFFIGSDCIGQYDFRIHKKSDASLITSTQKGFREGDYLLVRRSLYGSDFRERAPRADFDGVCSADIITIREKEGVIADGFLIYVLYQKSFWDFIVSNSNGGLTRRIKWRQLADYEFALPPLDIQKEISDKLWAAYRLKETYKRLLAATDEMVKSQFIEWFGNAIQSVPLEDVVEILDNKRKPLNDSQRSGMKSGQLYPYYGATGVVDYVNAFLTDEDLICLAEDCGAYGPGEQSSYIIEGKAWVNNHAHVLRAKDNVILKYLQFFFTLTDLNEFISGTTRKKLTQSALKKIRVTLPDIELQELFVAIAEQADKSKFELKRAIEAIDKVIKSLING